MPSLSGTHVLAVDDDPDALGLLREMLEAVGASVTTATSGRAALEVVEADRPNVLIADLGILGMDGFELIRQLRASDDAALRDIPAAALTAYARSEPRSCDSTTGLVVGAPGGRTSSSREVNRDSSLAARVVSRMRTAQQVKSIEQPFVRPQGPRERLLADCSHGDVPFCTAASLRSGIAHS